MIKRGAVVGSNRVRANLSAIFNFGLRYDNGQANEHQETIFNLQGNPVTPVPKQAVEKPHTNFLELEDVHKLLACADKEFKKDVSFFFSFASIWAVSVLTSWLLQSGHQSTLKRKRLKSLLTYQNTKSLT